MKEKILVTSATGKSGFQTTVQLLADGYPVRILVRSKNEKALQLEKLGAEIALGDLTNGAGSRIDGAGQLARQQPSRGEAAGALVPTAPPSAAAG